MRVALSIPFYSDCARTMPVEEKRKIGVAWLDLENALGLVPTNHLLGSMDKLLTSCMLEVVRDIYMDSTTRVKIGKAHTDVLECQRSVNKQGCPFSPILFNLALEQLVSGLEKGENFC